MSKRVTLTIDGIQTMAGEGTNLIAAANSVGIHIPNLCHVEGLKGIGACRLCLVEIRGLKVPVTACTTKVKEGMEVHTQTERVREIRKCIIDLILSMHPLDCMTCTKAGVCNLQQYAYDLGIKKTSFHRKSFDYPVDQGNPFIRRDPDYCILCGRCVRVCKKQGTSVLDFYGRGIGARVMTASDLPLQESGCTFCGSCVDACPVGALVESDRPRKGREWECEKFPSICLSCGNACDTTVSVHNDSVAKVNAGATKSASENYICAYGRYGYEWMTAETRVLKPMIRMDGELTAISWEDAFHVLADAFLSPHEVGFATAGNLLNEDILTIRDFTAAAGIKTVTSTVALYADRKSLLGKETDMDEADLIVLAGLDPSQWERVLPALDAAVRGQAARGVKLIVLHAGQPRIVEAAQLNLLGDETASLAGMAMALQAAGMEAPNGVDFAGAKITPDIVKAAQWYAAAKRPIILSSPLFFEAAVNIALMKGQALSIPIEANAKGTLLMGLHGENGSHPSFPVTGKKVVFVAGEIPFQRPHHVSYLIVAHSHMNALAREADLVLPVTTSFESQGTIVDYAGRVRTLKRAVKPMGRSKMIRQILEGAAKAMSLDVKAAQSTDVKRQLNGFRLDAKPSAFVKREDLKFEPETLIPALNRSMIGQSRLSWLTNRQDRT